MSQETLSDMDVSAQLADEMIVITPTASQAVADSSDPDAVIETLVEQYGSGDSLDKEDVEEVIQDIAGSPEEKAGSSEESDQESGETDQPEGDSDEGGTNNGGDEIERPDKPETSVSRAEVERNDNGEPLGDSIYDRWPEVMDQLIRDDRPPCEPREEGYRSIEVDGDITGKSTCTGTFDDFSAMFRSRYEKLKNLLETKLNPMPLDSLQSPYRGGDDVEVVGMVRDTWTSRNDNAMLELEDTTGATMRVVFTDEEDKNLTDRIVQDEVVGVEGQLSDDAGIIFGNDLHFPDVPYNGPRNYADRTVRAAFISDVHLGAEEFAYDKWDEFVDWIRQQGNIEYLVIGGDLVEGIGVYPDQDEELDVVDIHDQYKICAEALRELPSDMDIISIVGNHDTVRLAEPQPALPEKYSQYFADNVTIVGNPSLVTLEGVEVLMYHGMSINTFTDNIMEASMDDPTSAMRLMLEKRHLAPIYGSNVRLAPEDEDHLVIENVPDILHCGHIHKYGAEKFRTVTMLNTSCWQYQTAFQKSKDINPDVGYVTVMDLSTQQYDVEEF